MTALATGTSKTLTLRDTGSVTISTSGGIASVLATPTGGTAQTTILGPTPSRLVVGPFAEGATVVVTNQSATLDYDQPYGSLVTLNDAGTALVSGDGTYLGVDISAPPSTGLDQTAEINAAIAAASALYDGVNRRKLVFPNSTYYTNGIVLCPNVELWFGPAKFLKVADGTTLLTQAVVQCPPTFASSSWYGSFDNIKCVGGTFYSNGKSLGYAGLFLANVTNFEWIDLTYVHSAASDPFYATWIGGKNVRIVNPTILGGTKVGQDGLHITFGDNISVIGGYVASGDDAIALGVDPMTGLYASPFWDDVPLTNVSVVGTEVYAVRGAAVKVYYPAGTPYTGTWRHRIDGVIVRGVTGSSGIARNGGVSVTNDSPAAAVDVEQIRNIDIEANINVGSTTHDGTNAYGAVIKYASDVRLRGKINITDSSGYNQGYQDVVFSPTINSPGITLLVPATTYNFQINVDGTGSTAINVLGSTAQTFAALVAAINAALVAAGKTATCEVFNGGLRFYSNARTVGSAIALTAGTLFAAPLKNYSSISAAVPSAIIRFTGGLGTVPMNCESTISIPTLPVNGGWVVNGGRCAARSDEAGSTRYGIGMRFGKSVLRATTTTTGNHITINDFPGVECEGVDFLGIQPSVPAYKHFSNSALKDLITAATAGGSGTGTLTIGRNIGAALSLGSCISVVRNTLRGANKRYFLAGCTPGASTVFTTFNAVPAGVGVNGYVITPNSTIMRGCRFARALSGTTLLNTTAISSAASRFASLVLEDNDFTDVDSVIDASVIDDFGYYQFKNNAGFVTQVAGIASITSGTTSITVSHGADIGLPGTTTAALAKCVNVFPITALASATEFFVTAISATSFAINVDINPGSTISFAWSVDVGTNL